MDFNVILIILGVVALILLVAHGLWSHRREKSEYFQNANTFNQAAKIAPNATNSIRQPTPHQSVTPIEQEVQKEYPIQQELEIDSQSLQPVTEQPISVEQEISQIRITLPKDSAGNNSSEQVKSFEHVFFTELETSLSEENNIEISIPSAQILAFEENIPAPQDQQESAEKPYTAQDNATYAENTAPLAEDNNSDQQFVSLFVVAAEGKAFQGTKLVQALEDLGLIFGESGLFHQHLNMSAKNPELFSVANINSPGIFDLYQLENFYTVGVVFFMQLPTVGNDTANLKTMICVAKELAKQLDGFVLSEQQQLFTEEIEQQYLARLN